MILGVVGAAAAAMFAVERVAARNRWPAVPGWALRALTLNGVQVAVVVTAGWLWDGWLHAHRPWSAAALGTPGGVALGYLVITLVYYAWHRARHEVDFLWRWLHQLHHSPQRLEIVTSFYKHPLEIAANGLLSSTVLYLGVGLELREASLVVLATGLAELFYHWNVPTPYWLGFVFQRPESHCIHHERGRHARNYSDLPIWDMLFGTFENRRRFASECGFDDLRELRVGAMLAGRDVHALPAEERS
jgi:sterol desaturase/sphingolipid hydroxylase (fatty acid hydroxylase superfamily)